MRNVFKIFVRKPEGKGWKKNITLDLKEIVCDGTDWIQLAEDRVH
jgi:hypothetical protein